MQLVRIPFLAGPGHLWIERTSGNELSRNKTVCVLRVILDALNSQERQTENHCHYQEDDRQATLAHLRVVHRQRHSQTAENQHPGIDSSQFDIQMIAGGCKRCWIGRAINDVGQEHAAEKHYFSDKKNPHSQRARLSLLLHVLEMVLQRRMAVGGFSRDVTFRQVLLPNSTAIGNHKLKE